MADSQTINYDPALSSYGISQSAWNSMNSTQQAQVSVIFNSAKSLYGQNASNVSVPSAIAAAKLDPDLVATYGDAFNLDKEAFIQSLNQLQTATSVTGVNQSNQFKNDKKAVNEASAAAGAAYSGFRGEALKQLQDTETGVITSTKAGIQSNLDNLTSAFESKYGTTATPSATINYTDPLSSTNGTITGSLAGGNYNSNDVYVPPVTGSQTIAQDKDVTNLAGQYINAAEPIAPVTK